MIRRFWFSHFIDFENVKFIDDWVWWRKKDSKQSKYIIRRELVSLPLSLHVHKLCVRPLSLSLTLSLLLRADSGRSNLLLISRQRTSSYQAFSLAARRVCALPFNEQSIQKFRKNLFFKLFLTVTYIWLIFMFYLTLQFY